MKNIVIIFALLISFACTNDTELKKSVFLPDEEYPELPKYSEWGYNTFGAYYDRQTVISNNKEIPIKIINKSGKTSFVFTGQKGSGYSYNTFTLTLTISDFNPATYSDLIQLNNTTLDLTDPKYEITINDDAVPYTSQIIAGQFTIKRAQNLLVDKKAEEVILSGVFNFQALINELPVTFENGRFDVGVSQSNFYKY